MTIPFVDLYAQYKSIKEEIDAAISQVLSSTDFIMGRELYEFEEQFAQACDKKHCIGVSSGTAALELALRAYKIGPGDEVITTPHTFIATCEAISAVGASISWVDINEKTFNLDPNKLEAVITPQTKAIIPVHLYGQPCDMDPILDIAKKHNIIVLEDCAQAHLAEYKGKKVPYGETGCFSFYPGKNLGAYGDAGAVVTDNSDVAERVRRLSNHGRLHEKYEHPMEGFGHRMDTLQAAILKAKLPHLPAWTEQRRQIASFYNELLRAKSIITPYEPDDVKAVYHLYVIRSKKRDELRQILKEQGVATGIHYPTPLHLQEAYKKQQKPLGSFPVTERISSEILSLPIFPELDKKSIENICNCIVEKRRAVLC